LGAVAAGAMGFSGMMAVINCDFGTGIRIAAPIGTLTYLNLCAQKGILVKDGRALELMSKVDTVLFDKTGTLTRERPEVGRIFTCGEYDENRILQIAAAAEQRFSHPIARAIQEKFEELGLPMPEVDMSRYHVGFGITVEIEGRVVRVGSARFLCMEGISIPSQIEAEMDGIHHEGHSLILVAVDGALAGGIELQAAYRPEIHGIVEGLRSRGIKHLAIVSGDHDEPTRKMAESLGMDRYFAEVLPQDKAQYVELLQKEGRTVCFVGDGINDSIALKKADVSVSLRGASSVATDTAQVVFMQESLSHLCQLVDVARDMDRNIQRSWKLIAVPNAICMTGVFALGFGLWHSIFFNNGAILLSFLNGIMPMRQVAEAQAEKTLELEFSLNSSSKGADCR
jgi:Cu2+-exporting ATPase